MWTAMATTILRAVRVVVAVFGPTGVGKTAVAIALADRLRAEGEDPVAVSADALQGAGAGGGGGPPALCRPTRCRSTRDWRRSPAWRRRNSSSGSSIGW